METPQTPPNARQVTQDPASQVWTADWWEAELAARAVRWQTSIADFRQLVAMAEKTAANAREIARVADEARHRVLSTCHLGEYAVADVTEAHLRCLSAAAALSALNTQDTALAAQQAYDLVTAACARQTQPYTTETEIQDARTAFRAIVEAEHATRSARRAAEVVCQEADQAAWEADQAAHGITPPSNP